MGFLGPRTHSFLADPNFNLLSIRVTRSTGLLWDLGGLSGGNLVLNSLLQSIEKDTILDLLVPSTRNGEGAELHYHPPSRTHLGHLMSSLLV